MPVLLDLFCGAGGAAMGYHLAGFDVIGVDIEPQLRYPFEFHQADALSILRTMVDYPTFSGELWRPGSYDAIHASPPCQAYSMLNKLNRREHPALIEPVRKALARIGLPYVIENVVGVPLPGALVLCGSEFGLTTTTERHGRVWLKRHRLFESNVFLVGAGGCNCYGKLTVPVYGHGPGGNRVNMRGPGVAQASREVMGIDWMTRDELDQAIPPAYCRFIGEQLLAHIGAGVA